MIDRQLHTRLDLLKPSRESQVLDQQAHQKATTRELDVGERVSAKNFRSGPQWIPGVVSDVSGPLTYLITLEDGRVIIQYVDHLQKRGNTRQFTGYIVLKDKSDITDSQAADDVENSTPSETVTPNLPRDPMFLWNADIHNVYTTNSQQVYY